MVKLKEQYRKHREKRRKHQAEKTVEKRRAELCRFFNHTNLSSFLDAVAKFEPEEQGRILGDTTDGWSILQRAASTYSDGLIPLLRVIVTLDQDIQAHILTNRNCADSNALQCAARNHSGAVKPLLEVIINNLSRDTQRQIFYNKSNDGMNAWELTVRYTPEGYSLEVADAIKKAMLDLNGVSHANEAIQQRRKSHGLFAANNPPQSRIEEALQEKNLDYDAFCEYSKR